MVKLHKLEINSDYADLILCGDLTFDVRPNHGFQKGDLIKYTVVEGLIETLAITQPFSDNDKLYEITYVHSGVGLKDNFVVLGIRPFPGKEPQC